MPAIVFANARVLDGTQHDALADHHVLVENGTIREVSDRPIAASGARVVELAGKTLMPGLIDCHVHVIATTTNLTLNAELPNTLVALRSAKIMREMLMRGFTTVRDLGGADHGLVMAIEEGLVEAPRLVICGKALSQTGGHNDFWGGYHPRNVDS